MNTLRLFCFGSLVLLTACGEQADPPVVKDNQSPETEAPVSEKKEQPEKKAVEPPKMNEREARKEAMEDKVMDLVWKIPEVADLNESIRNKTKDKRGLSTFIAGEPSDDQEFYLVSVAEDNGGAYATYYQFCVYPDFSVRYMDVVSGEIISLEKWRRQLKKEEHP